MWHAAGYRFDRAKLKTKWNNRQCAGKNLRICSRGATCTSGRQRLLVRRDSMQEGFFWLKFCSSWRFNRCHTEQQELPIYSFRVKVLLKHLTKKTYLLRLLAEVPRLCSSGDFAHLCCHSVGKSSQQLSFHPHSCRTSLCRLRGSLLVRVQPYQQLPIN